MKKKKKKVRTADLKERLNPLIVVREDAGDYAQSVVMLSCAIDYKLF